MVQGGTTDVVGNFLGWWEKREFPHDDINDLKFTITSDYAYRPDKIAYKLYGRDDFAWIVLQYNNIVDINEEMGVGAILRVPSYDRALFDITGNS